MVQQHIPMYTYLDRMHIALISESLKYNILVLLLYQPDNGIQHVKGLPELNTGNVDILQGVNIVNCFLKHFM